MGYQSDESGFVSLLSYLNIVYAYICDTLFFETELNFLEILAAFIILTVAISVAYYKIREANGAALKETSDEQQQYEEEEKE